MSDEENWDDDGERKNDDNSPIVPLPQTEPMSDSEVDFDDGGTGTVSEKPTQNDETSGADGGGRSGNVESDQIPIQQQEEQRSVPLQQTVEVEQSQPKTFDIFDDTETATNKPQDSAFQNNDDSDTHPVDNHNESAECNTTPLYDEPEEKKDKIEKDQHIEANVETIEENKLETELPTVPGVDD